MKKVLCIGVVAFSGMNSYGMEPAAGDQESDLTQTVFAKQAMEELLVSYTPDNGDRFRETLLALVKKKEEKGTALQRMRNEKVRLDLQLKELGKALRPLQERREALEKASEGAPDQDLVGLIARYEQNVVEKKGEIRRLEEQITEADEQYRQMEKEHGELKALLQRADEAAPGALAEGVRAEVVSAVVKAIEGLPAPVVVAPPVGVSEEQRQREKGWCVLL